MGAEPATRPSLLVRIRDAGDGPAWSRFVEIYAPLIYRYARRQGLQDADAADLTQDVLAAVSHGIRRLEYDPGRGSFRGWLFTVTRNKLRTWWQRRNRQEQAGGDTEALQLLQEQPAIEDASAWESEYRQRLFSWAAAQVRGTVEKSTWQAFWQTAVEGKKAGQASDALGMSVAAVYMARSRVLARLKELVQEVLGEEDDA
jgi:RNA polymerase sigma-70 factor (ECF subfamily)